MVASFPFIASADAQKAAPPSKDAPLPKMNYQPGPVKIPLGHQLTLDLPAEHVYLNPKDAKILLEKSGNFVGDGFLGIILPKDDTGKSNWWVSLNFEDEGYVKDDEKINADDLLKSMKDGLEDYNKEREEKGFPPLFIDGWSDPPRYDKTLHHLVWALDVHSTRGKSSNYSTRILGRKGFVSINLVTDPTTLATDKPEVEKILTHTTFDSGARYADFNTKTDKVASYGLAALIAGGAGVAALKIAKIGIFAKFGKVIILLLAKFFKIIVGAFVALGLAIKRLFGGGDKTPPPSSTTVSHTGEPTTPAPGEEHHDENDPHGSGGPTGTA